MSSMDIDAENISITGGQKKKKNNQGGDTLIPSSQEDLASNSQLGDIDDFGKDNIEIDSHNDTIKDGGRNVMGQQRSSFNQSVDKIFDKDQKAK